MVLPEKGERLVDVSEVKRAVREGGTFMSNAELAQAQQEKRAEGLGASAFALGALDTASFGLSTKALQAAAPMMGATEADVSEAMSGIKASHETPYLLGQVGGAFLPGTAGALAGKVGGAVARGVGGVLGAEAATLGGRVLQGAAKYGAAGAVEGGLFGAGSAVSESAFQNHELTAEQLWAGAKGGAILGGALGAVGGGIAGALRRSGVRDAVPAAEQATAEGTGKGFLARNAEEQAFKATGAKTGDIRRLGNTAEEITSSEQQIGRRLLDEGIVTPMASKGDIAKRVATSFEQAGKELGEMRNGLAKATYRPEASTIMQRVREEILSPLAADPVFGPKARPLSKTVDRIESSLTKDNSFENLHNIRKSMDAELFPGGKAPMEPSRAWVEQKKVRDVLEDEYVKAADKAAEELGGKFSTDYTLKKARYSDLATVNRIMRGEVASEVARGPFGLRDVLMSGGGGTIGAILGGAPGAAAMSLASGLATKGMREYGHQMAASVLNKFAGLSKVSQMTGGVAARTENAVRKFVTAAPKIGETAESGVFRIAGRKGGEPRKVATREEFEQTRNAVAQFAANPQELTDKIAHQTGSLGIVAPNITAAYGMTAMKAVMFLQSKAPPSMADPYSLTPMAQRPMSKTLNTDELRFMRSVAAVKDPESVVTDLERGRINRQGVEALREVFPNYYDSIRQTVFQSISERDPKKPLPYQQALQLGILLDLPTSRLLTPEFIQAMQPANDTAPQGPEPQTQSLADLDANADSYNAPTDQLEAS